MSLSRDNSTSTVVATRPALQTRSLLHLTASSSREKLTQFCSGTEANCYLRPAVAAVGVSGFSLHQRRTCPPLQLQSHLASDNNWVKFHQWFYNTESKNANATTRPPCVNTNYDH